MAELSAKEYSFLKVKRLCLHAHSIGDGNWGLFTQLTDGIRMIGRFGGEDAQLHARFFAEVWNRNLFEGEIR